MMSITTGPEKYKLVTNKYMGGIKSIVKWFNDPQSLRDRSKAKPQKKWTEIDRLKAENRLLRAQLEKQEMEIAYAKKVMEIRNREGND